MSEPYRPSNGTDGCIFMAQFCDRCARHTDDNPCQILGRMFAFDLKDEEYPKEIQRDEHGPKCTSFCTEIEEFTERCPDTLDMFNKIF